MKYKVGNIEWNGPGQKRDWSGFSYIRSSNGVEAMILPYAMRVKEMAEELALSYGVTDAKFMVRSDITWDGYAKRVVFGVTAANEAGAKAQNKYGVLWEAADRVV